MLELRILDGLQTGARLKLPAGQYTIGDSDDCDVVLVGHGVEAVAMQLAIDDEGILATPRQPGCGVGLADSADGEFRLLPGQAFHVADIWLAVDLEDAPWPSKRAWLERAEAAPANDVAPHHSLAGEVAMPEDGGAGSTIAPIPDTAPPRVGRWLAVGCIATIACGSALAYVMKPASDVVPKEKSAINKAPAKAPEASPTSVPLVAEKKQVMPSASPDQRSVATAVSELEQSLAERKLSKQLHVSYENNSIELSGDLDSEQQRGLETILVPYVKKYGDILSINAHISVPATRLPFGITQIASGPLAHVVTDDGVRMFIGGSYKGYRLAAVRDHKLVFSGERPVEIDW